MVDIENETILSDIPLAATYPPPPTATSTATTTPTATPVCIDSHTLPYPLLTIMLPNQPVSQLNHRCRANTYAATVALSDARENL
jgi:hypothetical protein